MDIIERHETETIEYDYKTIKLNDNVSVERETFTSSKMQDLGFGSKGTVKHGKRSYLIINEKPKAGCIQLVDKSLRELHRQYNIFQTDHRDIQNEAFKYDNDPFLAICRFEDEWDKYLELLIVDWSSHTLSDLDGNIIAPRTFFNYMSNIRDGVYDLRKLFTHLSSIDSVELKSTIVDVPYYNSDIGYRKHFEFVIRPTDKEFAEILKTEPSNGLYWSDKLKGKMASYYGFDKFLIKEKKEVG